MNQTVEKWLTIGALVGWVASIASLVGLALRTSPAAIASRPAQISSLHSANRYREVNRLNQAASNLGIQQEIVSQIPVDTSKGYWVKSLKYRSSAASR